MRASCFSFTSNRSYQFLDVARSIVLISIIISDWILLLHVSMQQEQARVVYHIHLRRRHLGLACKVNKHFQKILRGVFHSSKTFEKLESEANGTEISSRKSFQKSRELLNFRNSNQHSNKNSRNTESKIEWKAPQVFG